MPEHLLIVGLGNPGKKYEKHRHNAGFLAVDWLAVELGAGPFAKDKRGEHSKAAVQGMDREIFFYKPLEFMNLSGGGVRDFSKKHAISLDRMVVLHDEIELPFAEVKWKTGGGHKGHNGLRDIMAKCGGPDFHRIRLGVGRPDHDDVAEYVLSPFSPEEQAHLPDMFRRALPLLQDWIRKSSGS